MSIQKVALKTVATLNPSAPSQLPACESEVAFVPMSAVFEDGTMKVSEYKLATELSNGLSYFNSKDILFAKITPCFENNKIAEALIDRAHGFGSTEFHVIRPDVSRLHGRYLLHFLRQEKIRSEGMKKMTGSAGQRRVPRHFLENIILPLPHLSDQIRIASILDKITDICKKQRRALEALNRLGAVLLSEMFGDPSENPRALPLKSLGDLISEGPINGLYKPAEAYGKGTKILRIDSFYDGHIENTDNLKMLEITQNDISKYALHKDDIVINRVNSIEYLGKSAIVPELSEPLVFESNIMRIHLDEQRTSPVYVINFLQTPFIKKQIGRKAKNAVNQSSINQTDVCSLQILCPPIAEQRAFAARVAEIDKLKALHRAHLAKLDELFASLQHRAFRGEL